MMTLPSMPCSSPDANASNDASASGGTLVALDGRSLPLRAAGLDVDCRAGMGAIELRQTFVNPYAEPLAVTYKLPLPADAAVRGFRFGIGDEEVVGRVRPRALAREQFEAAIVEGKTAALLEQGRSSVFTQELGNVPPGATVTLRILLDQKLTWYDDGRFAGWSWRFPTVVGPRYTSDAGRVPDAEQVHVTVTERRTPIAMSLSMRVRDALSGGNTESPSHRLLVHQEAEGVRIEFGDESVALDRDIVVRWPVAAAEPGLTIDLARLPADHPHGRDAFGLLTIVPPRPEGASQRLPRDLGILIDTSGSMGGEPLDQAKAVVLALVDDLDEHDTLELVEFSSKPRRWARRARAMDPAAKTEVRAWVRGLRAGGGTEMKSGILEALSTLRPDAQRQVLVVTDGYIGFEHEIVDAITHHLPAGCRVHCLGVGSAVNRSLTLPAARVGRGVEAIVGLGEDPERAAASLRARTVAPLVVDLELEGSAVLERAPVRLPDLFAGAPVLLGLRLRSEGGTLTVRGRTPSGPWHRTLEIAAVPAEHGSPSVATYFARERVEDLEAERAAAPDGERFDATIEALGVDFQIATRLTSWVAMTESATVDPRSPTRRETIPQMLPHGVSVTGLGLRSPTYTVAVAGAMPMAAVMAAPQAYGEGARTRMMAPAGFAPPPPAAPASPSASAGARKGGLLGRIGDALRRSSAPMSTAAPGWTGRLRRLGARWVVEVDAIGPWPWTCPTSIALELTDGRIVVATVVQDSTTRSGALPAGTSLRLVFECDETDLATTLRAAVVQQSTGEVRIAV